MKEETRRALNALNRAFYDRRSAAFDATRDHPWPGWTQVLRAIETPASEQQPPRARHAAPPLRVFDLGCGNGRFAHFLMHRYAGPVDYLGLDSSEALLTRARHTLRDARRDFFVQLAHHDFLEGDGPESLPPGPFDLIAVFGVLHHVPGQAMRRRLVAALAERLAPGGTLALTAWQFGAAPRFERSMLPADALAQRGKALGFDPSDLEPDDHLLGFGGDGSVPRYCHFIDEAEFDRLIAGLDDVVVSDRFRDDGKSADLNAYRVLHRPG